MYAKLTPLIDDACCALLQAKEGEANHLLSLVFDELLSLAEQLNAQQLTRLTQIMDIMHQAQQRRDYIYLVDILKYQLLGVIQSS